jgi:hypothetical protein
MNEQELKDLWARQKLDAAPPVDARAQIDAMRNKMSQLHRTLKARDFREFAGCAVVIIGFSVSFFVFPYPLTRIGDLINIGGALFVSWKLIESRRRAAGPDAGAPVAEWLAQERQRVHHQAELLRTVLWWYLLPFWVGTNLAFWGLPNQPLALNIAFTVAITLLYAWIYRLNQSARRKQLLPLQDELEALFQQESQAGTPPLHHSTTPSPQPPNIKATMKNIIFLASGLCAGFLLCYGLLHRSPPAQPSVQTPTAQPIGLADTTTQRCFDTLLAATTADDYDRFISVGDDMFRSLLTPAAFHSLSQNLAPRMQRGCASTYLGQLRKKDAQVSLWRLAFADGGDEFLARMSMSQDRVRGFVITPAF